MSEKQPGVQAGCRVAIGAASLVGACVLVVLALLRETPIFWTNAGGYPLWLRDFVKVGFYPLLLLLVGTLIYHSLVLISRWTGSAQLWCVQAVLVATSWIILTAATSLAIANNLLNLMEDRELHSHPQRSYQPSHLDRPRGS